MSREKAKVRYVFVDENTPKELEELLKRIIITKIAQFPEIERKAEQ